MNERLKQFLLKILMLREYNIQHATIIFNISQNCIELSIEDFFSSGFFVPNEQFSSVDYEVDLIV